MPSSALRVALLCQVMAISSLSPGFAFAGDEVDYSAPYITVENGELVTKYPAKGHRAGSENAVAPIPVEPVADSNVPLSWLVAGVLALLAGMIFVFKRRLKA
ncbi:MAG: hypothetical protein KJO82_01250 [Gammaproteobacteria bacterium]|nr:hypothetical protein [Gammaproteobacteria bacterium]NNC78080.1 hypothetical protein [Woeseiaceae bacterium]